MMQELPVLVSAGSLIAYSLVLKRDENIIVAREFRGHAGFHFASIASKKWNSILGFSLPYVFGPKCFLKCVFIWNKEPNK